MPSRRRSKLRIALTQITSAACLLAIIACGGSDDDAADPLTSTASAPGAAEAGPLAIEALNLHIDAPAGSRVREMLGAQMVTGPGLVVSVQAAGDHDPETLADAHENAEMFSPTEQSEQTLDDGWVLTYQNRGGIGTNYFVTVRREIEGTAYMCTTTASSAAQQTAAVEACRSLRR